MDLATLIGLIGAFGVVAGAILVGSSLTIFIDPASIMIVVFGTVLVTTVSMRGKDLLSLVGIAKNALLFSTQPIGQTAKTLIEMSIRARKEGLLALEGVLADVKDPFLAMGVQLVVDGHEVDDVDKIMSAEIEALEDRHKAGNEIFMSFATFAPAMGLIGTLIGLVQMLQNMDDPSSIGPAMAVALLTTFYGAIMANMVFTPLAGKLNLRAKEESQVKEMVISGILSISNGDNPRIVEQKLNAYLPPSAKISMFGDE